jgi:hypothetical protein
MRSALLPQNFRDVLPALAAMFAISATFSLYNFSLFQAVLAQNWGGSFIALVFNGCFVACILGFVGLFLRPMVALNRRLMVACTLLVGAGAVALFWNGSVKNAWVIFFIVQGAYSVLWHQNVRLTLIENAKADEYARIFSLYMISHLAGNIGGGLMFKLLGEPTQVLITILACYGLGVTALFFYPRDPKQQPFQGENVPQLRRFMALVRLNPVVWVMPLAAGYMGETFFNFFTLYLNQIGIAATLALSALAAFQIGGVLFKYPAATLMDKAGLVRVSLIILALAIGLNILLTGLTGPAWVILGFSAILGGVLCALTILGDTVVTTLIPKRDHQEASTLSILIYFIGGLLGNSLVGPTMDQMTPTSFPIFNILFVGLMLLGILKMRPALQSAPQTEA